MGDLFDIFNPLIISKIMSRNEELESIIFRNNQTAKTEEGALKKKDEMIKVWEKMYIEKSIECLELRKKLLDK